MRKHTNSFFLYFLIAVVLLLCILPVEKMQLKMNGFPTLVDNRARKSKIPSVKFTKFVYFAQYHTASRQTRNALRFVCRYLHISCVEHCDCGWCWCKGSNCTPVYKYGEYTSSCQDRHPLSVFTWGTYTVDRVHGCCKKEFVQKFDKGQISGIVDHFPRLFAENRQYLERYFDHDPKVFRFTILREPIAQYVAHAKELYKRLYNERTGSLDANLFDSLINQSVPELENTQSKFLGLPNHVTDVSRHQLLNQTVDYMHSLNLVCLYSELGSCYRLISCLTGWPREFFDHTRFGLISKRLKVGLSGQITTARQRNKSSKIVSLKLSKRQIDRIKQLQWADLRLYEVGKQLYVNAKHNSEHCFAIGDDKSA